MSTRSGYVAAVDALARRPWLAPALLALAVALAYGPSLGSGFVWDDHRVIEGGRLVSSGDLTRLPALFLHDTMFDSDGGAFAATAQVDTYRPLTLAAFTIERALFGPAPLGFHLGSLLTHLAAVLFAYGLGLRLMSRGAALAAALIFATHPAVGEAVHWIDGRSDPLCGALFLGALWAWLAGRSVAAAALLLAATLAKETAFLLLAAVPFLWTRAPGSALRRALPFLVGAGLGLACRLFALGRPAAGAGSDHLLHALARAPRLWLDGALSLLVPAGRAPPSLFEQYGAADATALVVALVASLAAAAFALRRRGLWGAGLAAFAAAMAPVGLLTWQEGWYGWGRYLYTPLPLLCLAAAESAAAWLARNTPATQFLARRSTLLVGALTIALAASNAIAAADWRDDTALADAMMADHPEQSMGYSERAAAALRAGEPARALDLCEQALALRPDNARHWSRAASALMAQGRRDDALAAAEHALALDPGDGNGHYIRALRRLSERREAEAADELVAALRADPGQAGIWNTLAQARARLGAASTFEATLQALAARPENAGLAARLADR